MLADDHHGARLGSLVAHLLGEAYLRADLELVEISVDDAVAMKIDESPIGRDELAVVHVGEELGDAAMGRHLVTLDLASLTPDEVLQLPPHRVEGVSRRHEDILVGMVGRAGVIDDEIFPGHPDFDGNLVQLALVVMTMRRLDGYAAPHDLVGKPLKALSLFPNPRFDRVRPVHIPEDRARYSREHVGSDYIGWLAFQPVYDDLVESSPDMFD